VAVGIHAGRMEAESRDITMVQDVPECAGMVQVILYAMRYDRQLSIDHHRINMIFLAIVRGKSSSAPFFEPSNRRFIQCTQP
jgi:hypothetical protein